MSDVLYARLPSETKGALESYASSHLSSVASAANELIIIGLHAMARESELTELRDRLTNTERALAEKQVELREAQLTLEGAIEREAERASTLQAFLSRAQQNLGHCPHCGSAITGQDVLIAGRCPSAGCGKGLTSSVLAPTTAVPSVDRQELLVLLVIALGVVAGAAWLSRTTS